MIAIDSFELSNKLDYLISLIVFAEKLIQIPEKHEKYILKLQTLLITSALNAAN